VKNAEKQRSERTPKAIVRPRVSSIFEQFHCQTLRYDFDVPVEGFDLKAFVKATGIKVGQGGPWSATIYPKHRTSGYHVHLRWEIDGDTISLMIAYWNKGKVRAANVEPFAETIMGWIGQFFRDPAARCHIAARFDKPKVLWKSRFNLPFKVTMAEREVIIEGVALAAPANPYKAIGGFLAVSSKSFFVALDFARTVDFARFDLREEMLLYNEAVKMFMEEI
jgi:hypothetical protein